MTHEEKRMIRLPMLEDIFGQVASLQGIVDYHTHGGQAAMVSCAALIRASSGRIIISGMGASFFAALPAVQALEAQGRRVHYAESSELLHCGQGSWQKGDVAILISRSGGSIETLQLAERLAASDIPIIALTNVPGSGLTINADLSLLIGSLPDELIAVQTYTGTVLALTLLAAAVSSAETHLAQQCAAAMPSLQVHIDRCLTESERWQNFLLGTAPLYLLGRGSALASIHEGALLFHETAKLATLAMSSGQFRHGPVEVVSQTFRAIVIGTPQQTSHLDWELASNLRAMGGDVRWLGPGPVDRPDASSLVPWPTDIPAALMSIFDIVPLQIAAYRTALWLGIRPGDFRYASEVTGQESGFPFFESSRQSVHDAPDR